MLICSQRLDWKRSILHPISNIPIVFYKMCCFSLRLSVDVFKEEGLPGTATAAGIAGGSW